MSDNFPLHKRVQFPRGTTIQNNRYVGLPAEMTVDMLRKEIRLHDGVKVGGHRIVSLTELQSLFLSINSEAGNLDFPDGAVGFLTRVSNNDYAVRRLYGRDGITIENLDGVDGHPAINLPTRLGEAVGKTADANSAIQSGFYVVGSDAAHIPLDVAGNAAACIWVIRRNTDDVNQFLMTFAAGTPQMFYRSLLNGVWTRWVSTVPARGTMVLLRDGEDDKTRTWSAYQLERFVSDKIADIVSEDGGGVAAVYGRKKLFRSTNKSIVELVPGLAANDRFLLTASSPPYMVARDNYVRSDLTIQVKVGGAWNTVRAKNENQTDYADDPDDGTQITARFVYTLGAFYLVDSDWAILQTINGAWSGDIKITSQLTEAIATMYRFRPKA